VEIWSALGEELYGSKGLVGHFHFLGRPSVKHGYIGLTGFVVFGLLLQAEGPLTPVEIAALAGGLVHRSTVKACLARLHGRAGVLTSTDPAVVASDWVERLDRYEREAGLVEWATRQESRHQIEREQYRERHWHVDPVYDAAVAWMRDWPCETCGAPSDTVDHFPLQAWGGINDPALITPSCRSCNSSLGRRAATIKVAPFNGSVLVVPHGTEEIAVERMAAAGLDAALHLYRSGHFARAGALVGGTFGLWRHVFRGEPTATVYELPPGVNITNSAREAGVETLAPDRRTGFVREASAKRGQFRGRTVFGRDHDTGGSP
jgi:hypothetical protein